MHYIGNRVPFRTHRVCTSLSEIYYSVILLFPACYFHTQGVRWVMVWNGCSVQLSARPVCFCLYSLCPDDGCSAGLQFRVNTSEDVCSRILPERMNTYPRSWEVQSLSMCVSLWFSLSPSLSRSLSLLSAPQRSKPFRPPPKSEGCQITHMPTLLPFDKEWNLVKCRGRCFNLMDIAFGLQKTIAQWSENDTFWMMLEGLCWMGLCHVEMSRVLKEGNCPKESI
jgi:hypothetical protein